MIVVVWDDGSDSIIQSDDFSYYVPERFDWMLDYIDDNELILEEDGLKSV